MSDLPELVECKLNIGPDHFGRRVWMIRTRKAGKWHWTIQRDAYDQRDDGNHALHDFTDENVRRMIRALEAINR